MYKGELMEEAPAADLYCEGVHPYTKLLFSSAAGIENKPEGDISDPQITTQRPPNQRFDGSARDTSEVSCSFAPRCPVATEKCFNEHPTLREVKPGHSIRCFNC